MRRLLASGTFTLLILAGSGEAGASHAWVDGNVHNDTSRWHNVRHSWTRHLDQDDNVSGVTFDAVDVHDAGWGRLAGRSDLTSGSLELLADSRSDLTVRTVASLRDRYTFHGAIGSSVPAVILDISYRGSLSENSSFVISVNGVQKRVISSSGEVSGVHTQRLDVRNGRSEEIHLRFEAAAWHGGTADLTEGIRVTFRPVNPAEDVLVVSDGGYDSQWMAAADVSARQLALPSRR